jgi:hypothetical protein
MLKRSIAFLVALMLMLTALPVSSIAAKSKEPFSVLLKQSQAMNEVLVSSPVDDFEGMFGVKREVANATLRMAFSKNITEGASDETRSAETEVTIPKHGKFTGTLSGALAPVETEDGEAIFGSFYGELTRGKQVVPVSMTFTHDANTNETWVTTTFEGLNQDKDSMTVVPFGNLHKLVVPTGKKIDQQHDAKAGNRGPRKDVAQEDPGLSIMASNDSEGRVSGRIGKICGSVDYHVGGTVAFGHNNVSKNMTPVDYGGRVYTNSYNTWYYMDCAWPAFEWNDDPRVAGAKSVVTLPSNYHATAGSAEPASNQTTYSINVPIQDTYLAWALSLIILPGKSISTSVAPYNSSYNNRLTTTWDKGTFGSYYTGTDLDLSLSYYQQRDVGFANRAFFGYMVSSGSTGTVTHDATIYYLWALTLSEPLSLTLSEPA